MTSEADVEASGQISAEMEERREIRDRRMKKKIGKNREMKKKNFSVKCAKSEYVLLDHGKLVKFFQLWQNKVNL